MIVRAFAKVNLARVVGARRADGYHQITTLFQTIDLADELAIEEADELGLVVEGTAPGGPENLVLRAATVLRREAGVSAGAAIRLSKRIPVGGGLGGGSSDAAAALVALDRLWRTRASPADLHRMALGLGSDVPFFLLGGTALGLGRGEELFAIEQLPRRLVVLALSDIAIATGPAFAALDAARAAAGGPPSRAWPWPALWAWEDGAWAGLGNDFEASVFAAHRRLAGLRDLLQAHGAEHARLSGSGATVYGLFRAAAAAEAAVAAVAASGVPGVLAVTLDRGAYHARRFAG